MIKRRGSKYIFLALGLSLALTGVGVAAYVVDKSRIETDFVPEESNDRAVCYNGTTNTKYTKIEKALSDATSGQTVYVYPELTNDDGSIYSVHIKENCTISSGVTLALPYSGTTVFDASAHGTFSNSMYFADQTEALVKQNRKTQVIIDSNVTLTVNGTLGIGGVLSLPTQGVQGQTSGAYCEITLSDNSSIVSTGTINCYGYIKRTSNGNGSLVDIQSGTLLTPFVIYDFKGGTQTMSINNLSGNDKFSPFQIFDFCNVQSKVKIQSGAVWQTRACVYLSITSAYYPENESDKMLNLIGPTANKTALVLTNGYAEIEYVPKTNGITTNATDSSKTTVTICGTADMGTISLSFEVQYFISQTININSDDFFFPICYRFSFVIAKDATFNVDKKVKFMNGSSLLVEEGAVMNITSPLIIYDDFVENTSGLAYAYPSGLNAAEFVINGIANVTGDGAIGGYISTEIAAAHLNYQSNIYLVTSPEYGGNMPDRDGALGGSACDVNAYSKQATGILLSEDGASSSVDFIFTADYESVADPSDGSKFVWDGDAQVVAIESVSIQSTGTSQSSSYGSNDLKAVITPSDAAVASYLWELVSGNVSISDTTGPTTSLRNQSTSGSVNATVKVTVTDVLGNKKSVTNTFTVPAASSGGGICILPTAKVLMADGSIKQAEDIVAGDMVMTMNHESGKLEPQPVVINYHWNEPAKTVNVLHLVFDNGKTTDLIGAHGYFDLDENKYVYISVDDYIDYIGHRFAFIDAESNEMTATLVSASINTQFTKVYSPITANNINFVVDDMLSVTYGLGDSLEFLFNMFEFDPDTLAYDQIKMKGDIAKYGLFDYEVFEPYISKEIYDAFRCKYLGVSIGKGLITWERIEFYMGLINQKLAELQIG